MSEPWEWTLEEAMDALRAGQIGAIEYAEALLDRAEAHADLGAYITIDREATLAAAGAARGRLAGAGLAIKDNIDTADMPTSGGTPGLAGRQTGDAVVMARLRAAGGIPLGKANLHELAFGITSNNAHFGPARNPWDKTLIPGGSSGGVAVAVAAGLAPAGIGTDTGGSCRIPAALCGVVGFRPTTHRWSQTGIVPISATRDTAGPLARSVADCRILDAICAQKPSLATEPHPAGPKIGVPDDHFFDGLQPEIAAGMETALRLLEANGAFLTEVTMPKIASVDLPDIASIVEGCSFPIVLYEVLRELSAYLYTSGSRMSVLDLVDQVAGPAEKGILAAQLDPETAMPAQAYQTAMARHREMLKDGFSQALLGVDALVLPTVPLTARPIGQEETVELNGQQVPTFPSYIRNCDPTAIAGLPCLSVPGGLAGGLPFGVEFVGREGMDGSLIALGERFEHLRGPMPRPPL
ncbi:MAG: amidase family protein [Pseudomonadota bacterium]